MRDSRAARAGTAASILAINPVTPPPTPQCSDGVNNDPAEDSLVDLADPACSSASDNSESPNASSGEPAPIAGQGYVKVFEDNFNRLSRGPGEKWHNSYYLPTPPADAVFVSNGLLNLVSRRSQGHPEIQLSTRGTSRNGADNWTAKEGYFEARPKGPPGQGSWPAFWTLNNDAQWSIYCPRNHSEIDMMDGLGPRHNEAHIGLHSNSWGDCEPNTHVNAQPATPNWTTQFVTFAARWTAERVDFYVNDQFVFGWAFTGGLARINQCAHNIAIKSACGGWHVDPLGGTGCTARSPDEIVSQFDWVRVWQKTRVGNGTYGLNP